MRDTEGHKFEYINRHRLLPWAVSFRVLEGVICINAKK